MFIIKFLSLSTSGQSNLAVGDIVMCRASNILRTFIRKGHNIFITSGQSNLAGGNIVMCKASNIGLLCKLTFLRQGFNILNIRPKNAKKLHNTYVF